MKIAVLVPFYNEEENLKFFVKEWNDYLNLHNLKNVSFFFIDDGSTDESVKSLEKSLFKSKLIFKIIKKKNSGHGSTCQYGYKFIIKLNFDYLLQIDSDNQCDPKYFMTFYNMINDNNSSFIFGYRKSRGDGKYRILISKIMSSIFFLKKGIYIKDLNTPYRMMNIQKLKNILIGIDKKEKNRDIDLYNCMLSYEIAKEQKINWIDIHFRERFYGFTKFSMSKMLKLFINFIVKI